MTSEAFKAPTRISQCGHSFCHDCLAAFTKGAESWVCPECRTMNNCRVETLARNFGLEQVVESINDVAIQPNQNTGLDFCDQHQAQMKLRKSL